MYHDEKCRKNTSLNSNKNTSNSNLKKKLPLQQEFITPFESFIFLSNIEILFYK